MRGDIERDVGDRDVARGERIRGGVEWAASTSTPFDRSVGAGDGDGDGVVVDRGDRRVAEPRRGDRDHARARADVEQAPAVEVGDQLDAELRRGMRAGPEGATRIDHDRGMSRRWGSHGGPTQTPPVTTGWWNARHASSQPGSTAFLVAPGNAARISCSHGGVGVDDESDGVGAVDLLKTDRREVEERGANDLGLRRSRP